MAKKPRFRCENLCFFIHQNNINDEDTEYEIYEVESNCLIVSFRKCSIGKEVKRIRKISAWLLEVADWFETQKENPNGL